MRAFIKRLFAVGILLLIGAAGGAIATGYAYQRAILGPMTENAALQTISDASLLSQLRLGQTDSAIHLLETRLDSSVLAMKGWKDAMPVAGKMTEIKLRALQAAKIYRLAFPSTQPRAPEMNSFLASVPDAAVNPDCDSALGQLAKVERPASPATQPVASRP